MQAAGRLWKHSTLADIDGLISREQIAGAFTFTLVRNPWDRIVSYYHWLRDQKFDHPAVRLAQDLDFHGFLGAPHTRRSLRDHPYAFYMTCADGTEACRAYIRLENLQQDALPLWDHLGFRLELGVENRSERSRDYRRYYTDGDAELVADICGKDIRRFGYRFA